MAVQVVVIGGVHAHLGPDRERSDPWIVGQRRDRQARGGLEIGDVVDPENAGRLGGQAVAVIINLTAEIHGQVFVEDVLGIRRGRRPID